LDVCECGSRDSGCGDGSVVGIEVATGVGWPWRCRHPTTPRHAGQAGNNRRRRGSFHQRP